MVLISAGMTKAACPFECGRKRTQIVGHQGILVKEFKLCFYNYKKEGSVRPGRGHCGTTAGKDGASESCKCGAPARTGHICQSVRWTWDEKAETIFKCERPGGGQSTQTALSPIITLTLHTLFTLFLTTSFLNTCRYYFLDSAYTSRDSVGPPLGGCMNGKVTHKDRCSAP